MPSVQPDATALTHGSEGTDHLWGVRAARFEALVATYGRLVARAVRTVAAIDAGNDLDDIRQEVMLALGRRLEAADTIDHPASYLYTAAVREAVRAVGRARRRAEKPIDDILVPPLVEANGESTVIAKERRVLLNRGLKRLAPERARAVQAHLEGQSIGEVMEAYGWTYQRARNLLARGVAELKTSVPARVVAGPPSLD